MAIQTRRQPGLTLIEMTVVIVTMALLINFTMPAVRAFLNAFQSEGGTRAMISSALASARAMATRNQRYTGIRFQKVCLSHDTTAPLGELLDAPQYMTFIVLEEPQKMNNLTIGFKAVEGLKPIRIPDTIGVIDLTGITADADINEDSELSNATSFSIIFSPSGKLVIHDVRVRNKDGIYQPNNDDPLKTSRDDVFNSAYNINKYGVGMFIQDDYQNLGLWSESSRTSFVICQRQELNQAYRKSKVWSDYLYRLSLDPLYVSTYTGQIVTQP
jgi:type II secretory pathway pseudopilin PulG